MIHYDKFRSSYSLSLRGEDQFSTSGGVIGGVGTNTTHSSYQNIYFGRDRHDMRFWPYQIHRTAYSKALFLVGIIHFMIMVVIVLVLLL